MTRFCPLCGRSDFLPVLHRPSTMVSSNVLYAAAADARNAPVGELSIVLCRHCGFVFNAAFDLALVPYGPDYDNDQSQSGRFLAHMQEMVGRVRAAAKGNPLRVIEIGCGQGQFLHLLLGRSPAAGDRAVGFDPSYIGDGIPGCKVIGSSTGRTRRAPLSSSRISSFLATSSSTCGSAGDSWRPPLRPRRNAGGHDMLRDPIHRLDLREQHFWGPVLRALLVLQRIVSGFRV